MTAEDADSVVDGQEFDFRDHVPINVISPFKESGNSYDINSGILIPYLTMESAAYSFGIEDNASQTFSLRGDNMQWVIGSPMSEIFTITAGTNQSYNLEETALLYEEGGDDYYVTAAHAVNPTTKAYSRLFIGDDYTNTSSAITTLPDLDAQGYTELHVIYATAATKTYPQTVHQGTAVKPAAVRGRDIDIYLGDTAATPNFTRWRSVTAADINWSVTLDADREFGNANIIAQDYDVPEVTGSVTMRARDAAELVAKLQEVTGVTNNVVGPYESATLPMEIRINDPETGDRLKTFYIPDVEFLPPGNQVAVQSKLETQFSWTSEGGQLYIYNGER